MDDQIDAPGSALAMPSQTALIDIFKQSGGIDKLIDKLERTVKAEAATLDPTTPKGREAIKSLAHRVSKSKAELERQSLALTEKQRAEIKAVNDGRRVADDRLSKLRDDTRKPVTDWEAADELQKQKIKSSIAVFALDQLSALDDPIWILAKLSEIDAIEIGEAWGDYKEIGEAKRDMAREKYGSDLIAANRRISDEAELRQLREAAAERARQDQAEQERKAAAQRAEYERRAEIAAMEARRIEAQEAAERAEQERAEQARRDAAERIAEAKRVKAEWERIASEKAAAVEKATKDAEARHSAEMAAAQKAARDKIAAEQAAADAAQEKRAKDSEHRQRIKSDIEAALAKLSKTEIAEALINGAIPHCKVSI
tara:strand:- start:5267 stop:6379 length:1113 start_codon:yes stop_codon:yes gene_type:complete